MLGENPGDQILKITAKDFKDMYDKDVIEQIALSEGSI